MLMTSGDPESPDVHGVEPIGSSATSPWSIGSIRAAERAVPGFSTAAHFPESPFYDRDSDPSTRN
jgi:hypothetical protein